MMSICLSPSPFFNAQAVLFSLDGGNKWHRFAIKLDKENQTHRRHRIRKCTEEDARLLSAIAGSTFLETYAGILPTDYILPHCDAHYSATKISEALRSSKISAALSSESMKRTLQQKASTKNLVFGRLGSARVEMLFKLSFGDA